MIDDVINTTFILRLLQNGANFNSLEELCIVMVKNIIKKLLEELDDLLLGEKAKGYVSVGYRTRTLITRVGVFEYKRRLYVKATKKRGKGRGRFLLDELLNIPPRRQLVGGLLQLAVSLSTRLTFRESSEVLEEAGFGSISHQRIHSEARLYGKKQEEYVRSLQKGLFLLGQEPEGEKKKVPILFLEVDGVNVKAQKADKRSIEVKLGAVHEGWEVYGSKGKRRLKELKIFTGLFDGGDEFWEAFTAQLTKYYEIDENTIIVVNGDGASWIQDTSKKYFPKAIVQLDRYHLTRDIRQLYPNEAKVLLELLYSGQVDVFVDSVEALKSKGIANKINDRRKQFVDFLFRYKDHISDYRFRLPITIDKSNLYGMGAAETLVDKKIANRMKKRGMRWSKQGAKSMAALLMLKSNGQLFTWLDEAYIDVPDNPVKAVKEWVKKKLDSDAGTWLSHKIAAFEHSGVGKLWVKVLKDIYTPSLEAL